ATLIYTLSLHDALPIFVVEAKNKGPFTLYSSSSYVTVTREILATKNNALNTTPITTPIAKLCVYKIMTTVRSITRDSDLGACLRSEEHTSELQSRENLV